MFLNLFNVVMMIIVPLIGTTPLKNIKFEPPVKIYGAPSNTFKSYMRHTAITRTTSDQYKLQNSEKTYTGQYGIRMVGERYCIALGSAYSNKIGTWIDIILENGTYIPCILADQKADKDTDSTNRVHISDGSLVEFVVDIDSLDSVIKRTGNVSNACDDWNSPVNKVIVYTIREEF